jgi:ribosomal-protein-alanine N-acetyltransferase
MNDPATPQGNSPSNPAINLRPMRAEDIPRVKQIADDLAEAPHWPAAVYEAALNPNSEPRRIALVAEKQDTSQARAGEPESDESRSGAIVGFVVASVVAGEAELESIAVAAALQGHGLGGQLLGHLLPVLREVQATRVNLEVRASNSPALRLYARHGFTETGRRLGYYADLC